MYKALIFLVLFATTGCATRQEDPVLQPFLAVTFAYGSMESAQSPAPVPDGPKVCPNCLGKGTVGDVTQVKITCPKCNGTGKIPR